MAVLRIQQFSGRIPMMGDRALPDNAAADAMNTWLYGGELRGMRPPEDVIAINSTTRKILRIPTRTAVGTPPVVPPPSDIFPADSSVWMQFEDPDTDICKGQLIEDQFERWYFCSPSTGPMFNTYARMVAGQTPYKLGVPGPNTDVATDGSNPDQPTIISVTGMKQGNDIYEIEFRISTSGDTAYTNPGGTGNRVSLVTTTGAMAFIGGTAANLVDGSSYAGLKFADVSASGNYLLFDWAGTPRIIDGIRWKQVDETSYGKWSVRGSNDGTTWDELGSIRLGGASTQEYYFYNETAYRYYMLLQDLGAAIQVTRAYLYTWENEFGEESAPSLPVVGHGDANGIWTIGNIKDPPAAGPGYPAYKKKNLYRTVTGESGQTTYYWVAEFELGTTPAAPWTNATTYVDDTNLMTDAIIVGNLTLESTNWALPPDNLQGWIAMPNGFLIGFDKPDSVTHIGGNNIYMSEAYHWHAWPEEYKQATETPVVGLGVLGQTCVVCTEGYPTSITGTTPVSCSFVKATTGEPCLSRGSIVSTPQGVIYASQNGLISVGPGGIINVTQQLITKDDWRSGYSPQYLRAVRYQNGYLALQDIPGASNNRGFFIDPTALKVALTEFTDFDDYVGLNVDFWSGEVFVLLSGMVQLWDPDQSDELMPVRWLSKEFQYQFEENFGCYAIYWDDARYSDVDYATGVMPADQKVRFRVWANRNVIYDQEVPRNGRGVRLPSGFKADIWQFEIKARAPVYGLHIASSMKELKGA
jgi:hypothetical protein